MARVKKVKPPKEALRPYDCVVLAIDPGAESGWAILSAGKLCAYGGATSRQGRDETIRMALAEAERTKKKLVAVAESWAPYVSRALQPAWMAWKESLLACGVSQTKIGRMNVATWRTRVLGKGAMKLDTAAAKLACVRLVENCFDVVVLSHNAAEAICLGIAASKCLKTGKRLPKKVAKAAET